MPDEAGLVFAYSTRRVDRQKINFIDVKSLVKSLITKGKKELLDLLPSELDAEELDLRVSDLKDNMAFTESIFQQNNAAFKPLVDKVFSHLKEKGEESYQLAKERIETKEGLKDEVWLNWLNSEEELLKYIMGGISLSTGIPGRSFQMADFRYASSKQGKRNLFICKSNVVIGFPRSKSFSRAIQDSLWALPPGLSQTVILYLGVIRPVSIHLMKLLRRKPNYLAQTYIFTSASSGNNNASARSRKFNAVIQSQTHSGLKIRLSVGALRHLITSIIRKHLNDLIDSVNSTTTSIANQQADRTQKAGNNGYGQNAGSLTGLGLSDAHVDRFIECSHGWQALLGIRSPGQKMQERLHKIPAACLQDANLMIAMDKVRSGLSEYGIGGICWETSQKQAIDTLKMKPFMPKAEDERLGDKTLIQVVSALIYGHGRPGLREAAPIDGYSVETILDAVALIRLGLTEWAGNKKATFDPRELAISISIESFKREVYENMKGLSIAEEKKWRELGLQVFRHTTQQNGPMKGPNLMDDGDEDNMDVD